MNIRKGMAALLAIAMILTSQSFASVVGATELTSQATQTQEVVEQQTEEDATGVLTTVADENEKGEAIEKSETLDTEDNKEVVSEEIKSSEKAISDDEQATQTEEAIISDVENTATDNAEKLEASDEESSDAISDSEKSVGEDDADVDDEGSVDEESDDAIEAAADYFKLEIIDGKSVLRKKTKGEGGKDMGDTVTILAGAEVIPDDIFQNNHTVRNIVFEEGSKLTTIAPNAFRNSYVESIKIPKGVTEIPSGAFMGSRLWNLRFEDEGSIKAIGVNAFNSTRIESITLPSCREVGESAFANCTSLSTVTMKVLETIGEQAFFKCSLLNDFLWSSEIRAIGSRAFSGCAFETIALNGMTKLRSISSSSGDLSTTNIGQNVFENNTRLKKIDFADAKADNITYIPDGICAGCTKLTTVTIPSLAITVGSEAFMGCTALTSISFGSHVQYIKEVAFDGCSSLKTIEFWFKDEENPDNNVTIVYDAFPKHSGVTMKAYDKKVEAYAAMMGYAFESKYNTKEIKFENANTFNVMGVYDGGQIVDKVKRRPGSSVKVAVSAKSGYILKDIYYTVENDSDLGNIEYTGYDSVMGVLWFKFTMPDNHVTVKATCVPTSSIETTIPTVSFDEKFINEEHPDAESPKDTENIGIYSWKERGHRAKIKVKVNGIVYGNWMYNFKSNHPERVAVDSEGVVSGLQPGLAEITITAKYNSKVVKKINIAVEDGIEIGQVSVGGLTVTPDKTPTDEELADALVKAKKLIDVGELGHLSIDKVTGYPVVTFEKELLAKKSSSVNVKVEAYRWLDEDKRNEAKYNTETSYIVQTHWRTVDSSIATVASATSNSNNNTINIQKGANGESLISIFTLNLGEKTANQKMAEDPAAWAEDNIAHIIVRVIDIRPRLAETNITINNQLKYGTPISVVPVYGYELLDDAGLYIAKRKYNSKLKEYYYDETDADASQFKVEQYNAEEYKDTSHYQDNYWYITTPKGVKLPVGEGKQVYKDLYLVGSYSDTTLRKFYIPMGNVTLINKQLAPKITQTGVINVFYNTKADVLKDGTTSPGYKTKQVQIKQSLTNEKVDSYALVSTTNDKATNGGTYGKYTEVMDFVPLKDPVHGSEIGYGKPKMNVKGELVAYDSFSYNFDITKKLDAKGNPIDSEAIITRSSDHLDISKVNNKNVVAGYLYIYYTEYKDPVRVKLTVKTEKKAPTYKLSQTQVTAYAGETGQLYPLYIYEKGKSSAEADRETLRYTYTNITGDYIKDNDFYIKSATTTTADIDRTELGKIHPEDNKDIVNDYLRIQIKKGASAKGKVVLSLRMTTWSDPNDMLKFTFNIKTTNKLTATLSTKKVTLNKAWVSGNDVQRIKVKPSSNDAVIVGIKKVTYKIPKNPKERYGYETIAEKILNNGNVDVVGDEILISQPEDEIVRGAISKGNYTFEIVPQAKLKNAAGLAASIDLKALKFTISVVDKAPTISIAPVTLNQYASKEVAYGKLKLGNLINGTPAAGYYVADHMNDELHTDFETDPSEPEYLGPDVLYKKGKNAPLEGYLDEMEYEAEYADSFDNRIANCTYVPYKGYVAVTKGTSFTKATAGTYVVSGVIMQSPGGAVAKVAPYKINLKLNTKKVSVTVKSKGEINMVMPASEILYTPTIKNVTGNIIGVKAFDLVGPKGYEYPVESRFYAYIDPVDKKTIHLRQRTEWDGTDDNGGWNDAEMEAKKKYHVRLCFGIDAMDGFTDQTDSENADAVTDVYVTPVNKFPKITVTSTRAYAYAGQDRTEISGFGTKDEYKTVLTNNQWDIIVTAQLESKFRGQDQIYIASTDSWQTVDRVDLRKLTAVDWKQNIVASTKNMFTILPDSIDYTASNGKLIFGVRLRDASSKIQNTTYKLKFAPMFNELQKKDRVEGTSFSIDVEVRK